MIERLLIVVLLAGVVALAYWALTRYQLKRAGSHARVDPLLSGRRQDVQTIVYFTTPTCAPCKLQQTPTLQSLQAELGDSLEVIRVDATEQPDAAQRWGVLSVPTMFVLNADGQPHRVYNGVVDAPTLRRALQN